MNTLDAVVAAVITYVTFWAEIAIIVSFWFS